MKKLRNIVCVLALMVIPSLPVLGAGTNTVWSWLTTSNQIYLATQNLLTTNTTSLALANSNTAFVVSNTVWSLTNTAKTTNFAVLVLSDNADAYHTNWMRFTNGFLIAITNNVVP